ncbi:MAG: wax ester/triacylglycerol synthase family O-acyltransferase [Runella sp.]
MKEKKDKKSKLQSISGMDATFLYAETPTSPMHVGSVAVIEGSLKYETFKAIIESRLHQIPKLRQRLMYVPFSIDYPYWVDDPHFDLDLHINHIALPQPGAWKQLREVASHIHSEPLDQSRPLWSMTFVEGLNNIPQVPPGSVAVISKIHHVAIDGMAGASLLSVLFDLAPMKGNIPAPRPFHPKPLPNELDLIINSTVSFAKNPLKFPKILADTLTATVKAGFLTRVQRSELPTVPFTAPATPFNGLVSPRRKWNSALLSLERILNLKNIMGMTVNDILLAICAGALRRYLLEKGKLPQKPLVAMVPVSTRTTPADAKNVDNQISAMLVQLATNIADPLERLEKINENTNRGKTYQGAVGAKTLAKMAEAVPFGIANQAAQLYSRFHLAERHNPALNVTITNVPGPKIPLYIHGHKLLAVMGMAPVVDGMGLIITIFSYNGVVTVSPTSDAKSMPDIDDFTRYIRESANELEALILEQAAKKQAQNEKKEAAKPQSDVVFEAMKKQIKKQPDLVAPNSGLFQFKIKGDTDTLWKLDFNATPAKISKGKASQPDATFSIADEHLMKIAMGSLDIQTAFVQGRLKVEGDFSKAMNVGEIMAKLPKIESAAANQQ